MSLSANYFNLRSTQSLGLFFHGSSNPRRVREFRVYRRRRLKRGRGLAPRSEFGDLFAQAGSLELLAPAIGLVSGLAALAARRGFGRRGAPEACDIGEWVLFASPTPFNRFVLLRCPSVAFEGGELLEGVSERLVREDRHYVRLCSGRVLVRGGLEGVIGGLERKLEYQRVCVSTDDEGVVSLDWPANLDLAEEHGLDTTLLVVPGSAQGSMDADIRAFVCEALRQGCFPVVMNPRGCAGSPLTTARLFTAADSDDICTAIQFINRARPWTTLMGVGWGYGANMLTKYLAEVGEGTPLTAAVCIDNPFDLEEATRSYPHHMGIDQKLTRGLVDILRSNKELFRGRAKGFDVEKALSATSVRDFEQAISMVSYGFEAVEDFYSKSSTRNLIGDVKIPVLFIQNDDGSAPLFSIPRSSIAENPFTSLLLCSCNPSSGLYHGRSAVTWCQQLTIEWLAAVELGLLKGRHPVLEDVDITINPSKGLAFVEGTSSNNTTKIRKYLDLTPSRGHTTNSINDMLEESDSAATLILRSRKDLQQKYKFENEGLQKVENGSLEHIMPADEELVKQDTESPTEVESGEAVQTAQVVMNMLDVTMPGTLTEEKKKKVLTAVDQGETVMKALQDAVPEDVREKLTTAASGILRSQTTKVKIKELLHVSQMPSVSSESMSKMEEKVRETSNTEGLLQDHPSSDQTKTAESLLDGSVNNQPAVDMPSGGMDAGHLQSESSQKSQSTSENSDSINNDSSDDTMKGKVVPNSENGLETGAKANSSSHAEKVGCTEDANVEEHKDQAGKTALSDIKEENNAKNEEKPVPDQSKTTTSGGVAENSSPSGSSSEAQSIEKEDSENQKKENKNTDPFVPGVEQIKSNPGANSPTFSVSQALDALTGMDDSTQVAVNSVFSVIEDMISQLEEGSSDESGIKDEKNDSGSASTNNTTDDQSLKNSEATVQLDRSGGSADFIHHESERDSPNGFIEKESTQSPTSLCGNDIKTFPARDTNTNEGNDSNRKKNQLVPSKLLLENFRKVKKVGDTSAYVTSNTYSNSFNNDYLNNTLFSEIPTESLDSDATTALLLEYFPEEGQWKLLEQPGNNGTRDVNVGTKPHGRSRTKEDSGNDVIEPLYAILDAEKQQEPIEEFETKDQPNEKVEIDDSVSQEFTRFVKRIILDDLKIEVSRKLGLVEFKEIDPNLSRDLEQVSNSVSMSIGHDVKIALRDDKYKDINGILEKVDTLNGEHLIRAISSAVQETTYLRRILPVGVVVGSSLAALRKNFIVATAHDDDDPLNFDETKNFGEKDHSKVKVAETHKMQSLKSVQNRKSEALVRINGEKDELTRNKSATVMVGAVTAALGASALLAQHQDSQQTDGALASSSKSSKLKADNHMEAGKLEEVLSERNNHNMVTSLAEKAMSVAGPVVPTKEDGEVDQERLVAILADLGQKGGILRLVGKVALLWGGIRGAMSLTDKLISFLRIAERPLIQRALGFAFMVLVLWSPVAVPLLPTLVQSWTTKNPSRIAELSCVVGLYTAVTILVMQWGKRIHGYENPPEQYGLDLTSLPKIYNYLMGLIGGIVLVSSIQAVNALLGCLSLSWPYTTTSLDAISLLKVYGQMVMVVGQGLITATGVALVEELLFRSWLPEEITADLGYHRGIIISGLVFSLLQRSPWAIPGLWLLSLSLSGIRQRSQGSLSVVTGLRAGILASSFILQKGGFLIYKPNFPLWLTGTHPFQPFSGITGFAFSLVLALFLYPRRPLQTKNAESKIQE